MVTELRSVSWSLLLDYYVAALGPTYLVTVRSP